MNYYEHVRSEIQPLLPRSVSRILDVGAGVGATLSWLKSIYPSAETTGLELNPTLYNKLKENADVVIIGDIDSCFNKLQSYDLILLLDVLEHLVDPVTVLKKLSTRLDAGGSVIVSVPNIAHLSVSIPLILRGEFNYRDEGILDRTHIRFFVAKTAIELLNRADIRVTRGLIAGLKGPRAKVINRISFGLLRHRLAKQYIMLGQVSRGNIVQNKIQWEEASR
jgi:2-polyprenyl-3-methyl-5-hydroxy-6-metoxy-1,4-benzoquinol methylase